jgi:hypothetical protein
VRIDAGIRSDENSRKLGLNVVSLVIHVAHLARTGLAFLDGPADLLGASGTLVLTAEPEGRQAA